MAKSNAKSNAVTTLGEFPAVTLRYVWNSGTRMTMSIALKAIASQLAQVPGLPEPKNPGTRRDYVIGLIGESGLGKTRMLKAMADANDAAFTLVEFAGGELADNLPIATPHQDPDNPSQYLKLSFGDIYREPQSKSGIGFALINEGLGADPRQQQQIRSLISNRQIMGVPIHPGWVFVLDSNPVTAEYFTNRTMDRSLEDRFFWIPVEDSMDEAAAHWMGVNPVSKIRCPDKDKLRSVKVTPNGMLESLYTFLRRYGGSGNAGMGIYKAASRRRWTNLGDILARIEAAGLMTEDEQAAFMNLIMQEEVVGNYKKFLSLGDNPLYYPIFGHKLLACATEKETKAMLSVLDQWQKNADLNVMIGISTQEVIMYLGTLEKVDDNQVRNMHAFLSKLDATQIAMVCGSHYQKGVSDRLWRVVQDDKEIYLRVKDLADKAAKRNAATTA